MRVYEADRVAAGASGGPGHRGIRANGRDPRELPLAADALQAWPQLAGALGEEVGWRGTGHLLLSERAEDRGRLVEIANRQRAAGIETTVVDGTELADLEPGLAPGVVAAAWCPGDGVADHTATTRLAAAAAAQDGAEILEGSSVRSLRELEAERGVLVAANQGTAELVQEIGVSLPLFPVFPQVVLAQASGDSPRTLIGHMGRRLVMKRMDERHVMVTGGRLGAIQPDGTMLVEQSEVEASIGDAVAVFPELEGATVASAVADRSESVSPDLVPIIDRIEHQTPVWIATGWSGHGFALAPAVARAIAGWMSSGNRPASLEPFGRQRFD